MPRSGAESLVGRNKAFDSVPGWAGILPPGEILKRNGHASESDFQHAVPVDAAIFRTLGHGHLNEAVGGEQMSGEVLELTRGKFVEPVEQFRPELKVVRRFISGRRQTHVGCAPRVRSIAAGGPGRQTTSLGEVNMAREPRGPGLGIARRRETKDF